MHNRDDDIIFFATFTEIEKRKEKSGSRTLGWIKQVELTMKRVNSRNNILGHSSLLQSVMNASALCLVSSDDVICFPILIKTSGELNDSLYFLCVLLELKFEQGVG
jgi:hypothetical protein